MARRARRREGASGKSPFLRAQSRAGPVTPEPGAPISSPVIKLLPILLVVAVPLVMWAVTAWTNGRSLRARSRPLKNDALEGLLGRLAHTAGVDPIAVRVLDAPVINGLATPSGDIYVTRGLVDEVRRGRVSQQEFASVVAHELGHLALGHTKRRAIDVAVAQAAHVVVGGLLARLVPIIGWHLARAISGLFVASLSRADEFEADRYATALMIRSGLGAEPQARMLEKLEKLVPGMRGQDGPASWLASHPPVKERARAIRENAARWLGEAG
jgi:putative metalloprotease